MKLEFIGHAAVMLEENGEKLLIDPFIDNNPQASISSKNLDPDYILLTHFHDDHKGEAFQLAKDNDSLIISTAEIAGNAEGEGLKSHPMHIGGTHSFDFGHVRVTPASHGSGISGGHACGFVINFHGKTIYHAGDTGLFYDMKLIPEVESLDFALLPIGSNFTMGIDDAVKATEFLQPKGVIPIHYNTWPFIEADPKEFQDKVVEKTDSECFILQAGESMEVS